MTTQLCCFMDLPLDSRLRVKRTKRVETAMALAHSQLSALALSSTSAHRVSIVVTSNEREGELPRDKRPVFQGLTSSEYAIKPDIFSEEHVQNCAYSYLAIHRRSGLGIGPTGLNTLSPAVLTRCPPASPHHHLQRRQQPDELTAVMTELLDLCYDVLMRVLEEIEPEDLAACAQTSWSFNRFLKNNVRLHKAIYLRHYVSL
jgi:hypothetical protein